jgi:SPP1 gp7 family putative phage head morphogenesis protein
MYAVETDAYARSWQRAEFKNGARPSQVIDLGTVTPQQYNEAVAAIRTRVDGAANAGRSMIVGSDQPGKSPAKVQHLSLTPAEMSYLESRVANADETMLAFGINPDLMRAGSTYENRAAAKTAWWSETLLGKLDTAASEFDRQLVPELNRAVGWDLSTVDALRESQDALIKRAAEATIPDLAMIDEGRAMIGLDPLPNGAGQYTITAYRERQRLGAQADFAALLGLAAGEVGRVGHAPVHRVRGRMITPRAARAKKGGPRGKDATLAHYDRHERIGKRAIRRLAERQEKAVLRQLKSRSGGNSSLAVRAVWPDLQGAVMPHPGAPAGRVVAHDTGQRMAASDLLDAPYWTAETVRMLEDFMDGTWADGGQYTADLFGLSWDHLDPAVTAAMTDRLNVLAGQITATTQAALEAQILQSGVEAGESIDDLARRLRGVFSDLSTWRSETIARTETVGGYNQAALMAAQSSGVVVSRSWLSTHDSRTRPSHQRQDGHTVTGDDSYPNGCRFPGDPSGPARETINCRCVELYATGPS